MQCLLARADMLQRAQRTLSDLLEDDAEGYQVFVRSLLSLLVIVVDMQAQPTRTDKVT